MVLIFESDLILNSVIEQLELRSFNIDFWIGLKVAQFIDIQLNQVFGQCSMVKVEGSLIADIASLQDTRIIR